MTAPVVVLPAGFVWDEPRKCVMCRDHCGTYYVPLKSYLHPECLSAFQDDAGVAADRDPT